MENKKINKMSLREFIDKNNKILIIIGVLLAILPFTLENIEKLNSSYAGYAALIICIGVVILLWEIIKDEAEYSTSALLFLGVVSSVSIIITLTITNLYVNELNQMKLLSYDLISIGIGAFIGLKLVEYIRKDIGKKFLPNFIFFSFTIFIFIFREVFFSSSVSILKNMGLSEYFILGFLFFWSIIILFGVVAVGLEVIWGVFVWRGFILPKFEIIKNKIKR